MWRRRAATRLLTVSRRRSPAGLSLIELLIVICVMAVLAGLVLPDGNSALHDQLESTAQILAADLAYGRGLAVVNNSSYRFTFDLSGNKYTLRHSGATAALNNLPKFPFPGTQDTATSRVVALDDLPHVGAPVRLEAVLSSGNLLQTVSDVEFGPLGGTTRSATTLIWFSAGRGAARRYISVSIHPVTGLASVGTYSAAEPLTQLVSGNSTP